MKRWWTLGMRCSVALAALLTTACATQVEDGGSSEGPARGIGKADGVFGSCFDEGEAICDGPAAEGTCWCDEQCVDFGDCCADKADACGGEAPPPGDQLCLFDGECGVGQFCNDTECLSGCQGGGDIACPAVCFGFCDDVIQQPELCLSDSQCGDGQVCDTSDCLSGCPGGNVACPAVCFGECVDDPEPVDECGGCGEGEQCVVQDCPPCIADTPPDQCVCAFGCEPVE